MCVYTVPVVLGIVCVAMSSETSPRSEASRKLVREKEKKKIFFFCADGLTAGRLGNLKRKKLKSLFLSLGEEEETKRGKQESTL